MAHAVSKNTRANQMRFDSLCTKIAFTYGIFGCNILMHYQISFGWLTNQVLISGYTISLFNKKLIIYPWNR